MGVGNALSSVFGGSNSYNAGNGFNPVLGAPGSNQWAQLGQYGTNNAQFQNYANQAQNLQIPQNVLSPQTTAAMGQQGQLAQQLINEGNGQGPNPALNQLKMTTGQNVNQAAGLAAANRGINPELAQRMALQQGANLNQQAVGQAGLQSAQQQLGAQSAAGQVLGQQVGEGINQGQLGLGLAQTQQAGLAAQEQARQAYENNIGGLYGQQNSINAGVAAQNAQTQGTYGQGAMSGISSALGSAAGMLAHGGIVPQHFAQGGTAQSYLNFQGSNPMNQYLAPGGNDNLNSAMGGVGSNISSGLNNLLTSKFGSTGGLDTLGQTPSLGGMQGTPSVGLGMSSAPAWQTSGMGGFDAAAALSTGGKILGKAKVDGDSEKNDNVPALLSPGEVVIPRTAMKSPEDAHAFLDKIIQKHQGPDYKGVMQSKAKAHMMNHGGEMASCKYCMGGGVY